MVVKVGTYMTSGTNGGISDGSFTTICTTGHRSDGTCYMTSGTNGGRSDGTRYMTSGTNGGRSDGTLI